MSDNKTTNKSPPTLRECVGEEGIIRLRAELDGAVHRTAKRNASPLSIFVTTAVIALTIALTIMYSDAYTHVTNLLFPPTEETAVAVFKNRTVEELLLRSLDLDGGYLTADTLLTVTELTAEKGELTGDLSDLRYLPSLEKLTIRTCLVDFRTLPQLENLAELTVVECGVEDITVLSDFPSLRVLNLSSNEIHDVSTLLSLKHLIYVDLSYNNIATTDLDVLLKSMDTAKILTDGKPSEQTV